MKNVDSGWPKNSISRDLSYGHTQAREQCCIFENVHCTVVCESKRHCSTEKSFLKSVRFHTVKSFKKKTMQHLIRSVSKENRVPKTINERSGEGEQRLPIAQYPHGEKWETRAASGVKWARAKRVSTPPLVLVSHAWRSCLLIYNLMS